MTKTKGFLEKFDDTLGRLFKLAFKDPTPFEEEKRRNMSELESADDVDKGIKNFLLKINKLPFFYTSSSCEGHLSRIQSLLTGAQPEVRFNSPAYFCYGFLEFFLKKKSKVAHRFIKDLKKFVLEFMPLNEDPKLSKVASNPTLEYFDLMEHAKEFKEYNEKHNEEISRYLPSLYSDRRWDNCLEIMGQYRIGLENWTVTKSAEKIQNIKKNFAYFWNGLESLVDKYMEQK